MLDFARLSLFVLALRTERSSLLQCYLQAGKPLLTLSWNEMLWIDSSVLEARLGDEWGRSGGDSLERVVDLLLCGGGLYENVLLGLKCRRGLPNGKRRHYSMACCSSVSSTLDLCMRSKSLWISWLGIETTTQYEFTLCLQYYLHLVIIQSQRQYTVCELNCEN